MTRKTLLTRDILVLILLPALAALAAGIAFFAHAQAQADYDELKDDLTSSQSLAREITRLRTAPVLAASSNLDPSDISHRIDQAAQSALFPPGAITRISPEQPHRIPDTPYRQRLTQVIFRSLTLQQFLTFATAISSPDSGMAIQSIRLVAPRSDTPSPQEVWSIELTLAYTYFDPSKDNT